MMFNDPRDRLNLVQQAIRGGNAVIVLGPYTAHGSKIGRGSEIPSISDVIALLCRKEGIPPTEHQNHGDIIDFCTRNAIARQALNQLLQELFSVKFPSPALRVLTNLVWHRIYTCDMSTALETAYRENPNRSQSPDPVLLSAPVTIDNYISTKVEIVKLLGTIGDSDFSCYLNTPQYQERWARSPWLDTLASDLSTRPILFCGETGDAQFLVNYYRNCRGETSADNPIIFITPDLTRTQRAILEEDGVLYLSDSFKNLARVLEQVFPRGRYVTDILSDTANIAIANRDLAATLLNDFNVLTNPALAELSKSSRELASGIRRFYRGDQTTWRDITDNVFADLTPYKNFRNGIQRVLSRTFPAKTLFLLTSPAGMGKTVGLMATAVWLRNYVNVPILWFRSDGNLKRFFQNIKEQDFQNGAYVFIDDIANYADQFENVPDAALSKLCFVGTAREARWSRYGPRIGAQLDVVEEQIRLLNRKDAEELHGKIRRFGTLIYFNSGNEAEQIAEILKMSRRDLLILVKELGAGERFEKTIQSEVNDLSEQQRFAYLIVCIPDRVQVSMPRDLFDLVIRRRYPGVDPNSLVESLGRLVRRSSGSRSLVSRHSVIAAQVVENRRIAGSALMRKAVEALIDGLSCYRVPIIVHHTNTGHARVFKAVINNRFLSFCLGAAGAIEVYHRYEKAFERDGFYWQQFGLTYLRAGSDYRLALETLRHAARIHDHVQIRHSLAMGKLVACYELGRSGLEEGDFERLRAEGVAELERLHVERQAREDIGLVTLVRHNLKIAERYDAKVEWQQLVREYHARLAFYLREHPEMVDAQAQYKALHDSLTGGGAVRLPELSELLDEASELL